MLYSQLHSRKSVIDGFLHEANILKGSDYVKDYSIRTLAEHDLIMFELIAAVHESLPSAWVKNYSVNTEEIEKSVQRLLSMHKTPNILCCVAEVKGEIVSFIWAEVSEQSPKTIQIISLWTHEAYRGKGIATTLKIELERWGEQHPTAEEISTVVSAKNTAMLALNEKLGYETRYFRMVKVIKGVSI